MNHYFLFLLTGALSFAGFMHTKTKVSGTDDRLAVTGTLIDGKRALDTVDINAPAVNANNYQVALNEASYIRASPVYNLLPANFRAFSAGTGLAHVVDRHFKVETGTTIFSYGALQSFRGLKINYGQTGVVRFDAKFATAIANSNQGIGLLSITDEISFGTNGTQFGVWHRYGGEVEVRTLTVTGAAGGAENATVTINGTAYTVPLTAGTVQDNAREIAEYLDANATGFYAEQLDDNVIVSAASDLPKDNTWAFSSATATANFVRTTAGEGKNNNFTAFADFNGSVFADFDYTKTNNYEISYGAGHSNIIYKIYNPDLNRYEIAHTEKFLSVDSELVLNNPALKAGLYVYSLGSTTDFHLKSSFIGAYGQGDRNPIRNPRAFTNSKSISTTLTNILTIRNTRIYNGLVNQTEIIPYRATLSNGGSKIAIFEIRTNPTIAGNTNFQPIGTNLIAESEIAGTTCTQDGRAIELITVAPGSTAVIDLEQIGLKIPPTLRLSICARQLSGGSASDLTASITWQEDI